MLIIIIVDRGNCTSRAAPRPRSVIILNKTTRGPERLSCLSKAAQWDSETAETNTGAPTFQLWAFSIL